MGGLDFNDPPLSKGGKVGRKSKINFAKERAKKNIIQGRKLRITKVLRVVESNNGVLK